MDLLLKENTLNKELSNVVLFDYEPVTCHYKLTNPNTVFELEDNNCLITDGRVINIDDLNVLITGSTFTIIKTYQDGKLVQLNLYYPSYDWEYIKNIVNKVMLQDKKRTKYEELSGIDNRMDFLNSTESENIFYFKR